MDIAILSDIHGNYEAFHTCVQYALKRNVTNFWFLGDYVGEFGFPQRTMNLLYELNEKYTCTFIRGNKEDYWIDYEGSDHTLWREHDSTTGSLYYTYHNLTDRDLLFFKSLKIMQEIKLTDKEKIVICHGSPISNKGKLLPDNEKTYEIMESCEADIIFCGHTHIQREFVHNGKKVINPGAVGVPLQSMGKTQFMLLNETKNGWKEEFVSLEYDVKKEFENFRLSGLSEYAPYWCKVTKQLLKTGSISHGVVLAKAMEFCREEEGDCIWPVVPEKYWEKAYKSIFGSKDIIIP